MCTYIRRSFSIGDLQAFEYCAQTRGYDFGTVTCRGTSLRILPLIVREDQDSEFVPAGSLGSGELIDSHLPDATWSGEQEELGYRSGVEAMPLEDFEDGHGENAVVASK